MDITSLLPIALIIPAVTVWFRCKPNGLPIATIHSPTSNLSESPIFTSIKLFGSTFNNAISDRGTAPIVLAFNSRLSSNRTIISSAFLITWLFVII